MKEKIIRPYSAVISLNEDDRRFLDQHLNYSAQSQLFNFSFMTAFEGLLTPEILKDSPRLTYIPGKRNENSKDKEKRMLLTEYPLSVHFFHARFKLVSKDEFWHEEEIITAEELPLRFKQYWGREIENPELFDLMMDSIIDPRSKHENGIWIDTAIFAKRFFGTTFDKKTIEEVLVWYPLAEKPNGDSFRTVFSMFLGDGPKSNFAEEYNLYKLYIDTLKDSIARNLNPQETVQKFIKVSLATNIETLDGFIKYLKAYSDKKGRDSAMITFVRNNWEKNFWVRGDKVLNQEESIAYRNDLIKSAEKKNQTNDLRSDVKGKNSLWSWYFESWKNLGIPYSYEHFSDFADCQLQKMLPKTKIFYNTVDEKWESRCNLINIKAKPLSFPWVKDEVESYKRDVQQVYLNEDQVYGKDQVIEYLSQNPTLDGLGEAQTNCIEKFGDVNLYQKLVKRAIEELPANARQKDLKKFFEAIFDDVRSLIKIDEYEDNIYAKKWPLIPTTSLTAYEAPYFGERSKPRLKVSSLSLETSKNFLNNKHRPDVKAPHATITLSLLGTEGPFNHEISFYGKRFVYDNLLTIENGEVAARNDALLKSKHNGYIQSNPERTFSFRVRKDGEKYKLIIAVTYNVPKVNWKMLQEDMGTRFMAVDLGQRKAGSYIILERVENGSIDLSLGEYPAQFNIVETGFLEQKIVASDTLQESCVLDGSREEEIPEDYLNFWKSENEGREPPKQFDRLLLDIAHSLKRYVRSLHKIEEFTVDYQKVNDLLDTALGLRNSTYSLRGQGGLSFNRMEKYSVLKSALSSLRRLAENRGCEIVESFDIDNKIVKLTKKHIQIRKERVRRTVNSIIGKMIDTNCAWLAREDLDKFSNGNRRANRRNTDWCVAQISKNIGDQAKLYEIFDKGVYPYDTSREDFFDNKAMKTRYHKVTQSSFNREKAVKDYKNLLKKDLSKHPILTDRLRVWNSLIEKYGEDVRNQIESLAKLDLGEDVVYVPVNDGSFFHSPQFAKLLNVEGEFVNADINAALNIFVRGFLNFSKKPKVRTTSDR